MERDWVARIEAAGDKLYIAMVNTFLPPDAGLEERDAVIDKLAEVGFFNNLQFGGEDYRLKGDVYARYSAGGKANEFTSLVSEALKKVTRDEYVSAFVVESNDIGITGLQTVAESRAIYKQDCAVE